MQLTPLEKEILNHRLEVDDCIAEALDADRDEVAVACTRLLDDPTPTNRLDKYILWDAVDGSTYCGNCRDFDSPQKVAAAIKAGRSLAEKVSEAINRPTDFPIE